MELCTTLSPQKHTAKESDGFHNHSNLLTMKNTDKRAANQMYIQKVLIGKRTIIGHDQKININWIHD